MTSTLPRSVTAPVLAAALLLLAAPLPALSQTTDAATPPAPGITLPLTARGNEPFWSVAASPDGLRLSEPEGKGTVQTLAFTQSTEAGSLILTTTDFTLRIDRTLCRDDMSGLPYPYSATLSRASTDLAGCAGEPGQLLAGDWTATDLNGTPIPAGTDVTLSFLDGRLLGSSGCNTFIGSYTMTGEGLSLGSIGATRMACPPAQMETEQAVFTAFAAIARFDIAADGTLLLQSGDGGTLISARRP